MKSVVIQGVDYVHGTMRRIYTDHRTVDRIWHCSVENPVPVRDPEGGGRKLIPASLGCRVRCGDLLCAVPEDLLFRVSGRVERLDSMIECYLEECHVRSMPCWEQNRAVCAVASFIGTLDAIPCGVGVSMNALNTGQQSSLGHW